MDSEHQQLFFETFQSLSISILHDKPLIDIELLSTEFSSDFLHFTCHWVMYFILFMLAAFDCKRGSGWELKEGFFFWGGDPTY